MNYKIEFENYKNNFSLPAMIVGDDIKEIDSDFLKVILLIFKNPDKAYSVNLLSNLLNLSEQIVLKAIQYWIERGVLKNSDNMKKTVQVISEKPTTAPNVNNDSELKFLLATSEAVLQRPVTSTDIRVITYVYESYRLPADVILMAIQFCVEKGKTSIKYIESVCVDWYNKGITSHLLAEEFLNNATKQKDRYTQIKQIFGIAGRNLIPSEEKFMDTWCNEYQFSNDIIQLAYERTIKNTGKVAFAYTNKILLNWHKKGYQKLEDILQNEGGKAPNANSDASYDLDELEEYWSHVPNLNK